MTFHTGLAEYTARVNTALAHFIGELPLQQTQLLHAMGYGALLGGKRLRPFLVYATGGLFGVSPQTLDVPAVAVECIHAYSLIHDDLPAMDNDDLRRGQPACHKKFGDAQAILAGDALQTLAFSVLSSAQMPEVSASWRLAMVAQLAQASGVAGMCGGQALDLAAEGQSVSLAELERIHRYKTGALISAAVKLGALTAGERAQQALPLLEQYALHIGLAFQVQDDILDIVGNTATLGKHQGADARRHKSTYPALLGLDAARQKAHRLCQQAQTALVSLTEQGLDCTLLAALAQYIIQRDS